MSRVIRPDSPSRLRGALLDSIRATLPALGAAPSQADLRDRLAFIALALTQVQASVEPTAEAWERRSYWVKADRFRRDWSWVRPALETLLTRLHDGDLAGARQAAMLLEGRLPPAQTVRRRDLSGLWNGSYERLMQA